MNDDETFSITLDDDVTINLDSISSNTGTYSITSSSTLDDDVSFTLTGQDNSAWADNINWEQTEWKDTMPSINKIHNMCKHYPALEKAYEKFKTIYKMVEQDYKGHHEQDEELPF